MKKFLEAVLWILLALLSVALLGVLFLTVAEYRPADREDIAVTGEASAGMLAAGEPIRILSWNIGYAGLGAESDFFLDGGKGVASADEETVKRYLSGISETVASAGADIVMLQEVDLDSSRSYGIDERESLSRSQSMHALNMSCLFVPYPIPPIGHVETGVFTTTDYEVSSAERISLPCPFRWPVRICNLKRCMLVSYFPIEGSGKQLVLINTHLEAYDSGEGKIAQTRQLQQFITAEYEKGNYVIAGGDFNQSFPGTQEIYPNTHADLWAVGSLGYEDLPDGCIFAFDPSVPTCRLLNQPYDPTDAEGTQYYVIDGFILTPNIQLDGVQTLDEHFENSDHNPVSLSVTLLPEN